MVEGEGPIFVKGGAESNGTSGWAVARHRMGRQKLIGFVLL
jgi:hypothetical protein